MTRTAAIAGSLLALLALPGCSSIPNISLSDFMEDRTQSMGLVDNMPTEAALSSERLKVIVMESSDGGNADVQRAQLPQALTRDIEAMLGANGVEVIDRSVSSRLDQEIRMCEMQANKCGIDTGPAVARYAVKATITRASYGARYVERQVMKIKGKDVVTDPYYSHSAAASVSLKVYELPSMREVKAIVGSDTGSNTTPGPDNLGYAMVTAALKSAISTGQARADFLNLFAPRGYVIGKRGGGKKSIFKVSIGSAQGLVPGAPVVILAEETTINPITKKPTVDMVDVAKARVSNIVTSNEAWIVLEDEDKAALVKLGQQAKVFHEKGNVFFEKLNN